MPSARPPIRDEEDQGAQKVDLDYGKMLLTRAKERGLTLERWAELAGLSAATASRLTTGKGSVKAARALRHVLVEMGEQIPPIVFDAGSPGFADDWLADWSALGSELRSVDLAQYEQTCEHIREFLRAHAIVKRGIQLIADPLPRNPEPSKK